MSNELVSKVRDAVSKVNDPHMGVSIVEMGLVQNIEINDGVTKITIKPTNPGCMSVTRMANDAKREAEGVDGIDKVEVYVEGHVMAESINEMINQ